MLLQGLGLIVFSAFNIQSWLDMVSKDSVFKTEEGAYERLEDVANATEECRLMMQQNEGSLLLLFWRFQFLNYF